MRAWPHNGKPFVRSFPRVLMIVRIRRVGQKGVPNVSLASFLTTAPTLSKLLALASFCVATSVPLYTLFKAARPSSQRPSTVQQLFLRAFTFALLLTLSLLHVGAVVASTFVAEGEGRSEGWLAGLAAVGLEGPVELARVGYALGAATWILARAAAALEGGEGSHYKSTLILAFPPFAASSHSAFQ
jgi:hypothetical protein